MKIKLTISPSEASCKHIHIKNEAGRLLDSITFDDVLEVEKLTATSLLKQIRAYVKSSGLRNIDLIKADLELKEFEI